MNQCGGTGGLVNGVKTAAAGERGVAGRAKVVKGASNEQRQRQAVGSDDRHFI